MIARSSETAMLRVAYFGLVVLICGIPSDWARCGLAGLEARPPAISDWALEQLNKHQVSFDEAAVLFRDGDLEACRNKLSQLRMTNPALPGEELVIVWLLLSDRKLLDAKMSLERIAAATPRDPQVALTLGQVALAENRLADAASHLERAALLPIPTEWSPQQQTRFALMVFQNLAATYESQQRWQDVRAAMQVLLQLQPDEASNLARMARACYQTGEKDKANQWLRQASELMANAIPVELFHADIAFSAGNFEEVKLAIAAAMQKYPSHSNVILWNAEWLLFQGQTAEARKMLEQLKRGETSSRFWIPMGQVELTEGNYTLAVEALDNAVELIKREFESSRKLAATESLLAVALTCQGGPANCARALKIAERLALEMAHDVQIMGIYGWVTLKNGNVEDAELLLKRAISMSPKISADLSFFLAELSHAKGESDLTRNFIRGSLEGTIGFFALRHAAEELANKVTASNPGQ